MAAIRFRFSSSSRIIITLISFVVILFLSIYNKQVCPFMSTLYLMDLMKGLAIVALVQVVIRELLNVFFLKEGGKHSPPYLGYRISVVTWLLTGLVAIAVHRFRYPDFPFGSHFKLISGYWALGAGLLAQLELAIYEDEYRRRGKSDLSIVREQSMARRMLVSNAVFTAVPVFTLLMVLTLYVHNGFVLPKVRTEALFLGCFFVAVSSSTFWLYGRKLRKDTEMIISGLNQVSSGDFSTELDTSRQDELGKIAHGINDMSKGLQLRERIRDAFGKFVSREVAEEFIEKYASSDSEVALGGARRHLAVLYCDIRSFTPLAESLTPEDLADLLNEYFTEMVSVIKQNNGVVDKFIGDAIMAVFGLSSSESAELDAVKAAQAMRKQLASFNSRMSEKGFREINNGIGIHSGEMIAGYFGSRDRLEFTVIGSNVNISARIESQAKVPNPPVLFSKAVADTIGKAFNVREVGDFELKGVSGKQKLYTLV